MKRFLIRTIQDGTVKINGALFEPNDNYMKYDGRLDGLRFAFAVFQNLSTIVALWGTAENYKRVGEHKEITEPMPEIVNGGFPWQYWHKRKVKGETA